MFIFYLCFSGQYLDIIIFEDAWTESASQYSIHHVSPNCCFHMYPKMPIFSVYFTNPLSCFHHEPRTTLFYLWTIELIIMLKDASDPICMFCIKFPPNDSWGGWGCEVSCGGHHRPKGKTTTGSALDGAVFDTAQILAYLVHNMSRSQLYLGFGHFGWLLSFFGQ